MEFGSNTTNFKSHEAQNRGIPNLSVVFESQISNFALLQKHVCESHPSPPNNDDEDDEIMMMMSGVVMVYGTTIPYYNIVYYHTIPY